jgi:hypothetical protein
MAPQLRFTMLNGDEWISEGSTGGGLSDEVAFEREFKISSAVISIAAGKAVEHLAAVAAAVEAGEEPPEPDGSVFPRSEWMAFFAWRQLRRANPGRLPARFATFVEEVDEMEYLPGDDAAAPADDTDDEGDEADDVDPLVVEAVALNGSGLDPTAPDPRPSPPLSSFSMASATPPSN